MNVAVSSPICYYIIVLRMCINCHIFVKGGGTVQNKTLKKIWMVTLVLCLCVAIVCVSVVSAVTCADNGEEDGIMILPAEDDVVQRVESAPVWTSEDYDATIEAVPNRVVLSEKDELRAVWIPYMSEYSIDADKIDTMVAECKAVGANAIIFHVRPFGDALYDSIYFPWSHIITGTQGIAPENDFDPLEYIIERAHENGMQLHAWINPLRIQLAGGKTPEALSSDNPYVVWRGDSVAANDDWVVDYKDGKFYNPSNPEVRSMIADGMAEIAANYRVDGVHWDDYFYPANDGSFDDSVDYQSYKEAGGKLSLVEWRTVNINELIKEVYNKVKAADSNCVFGISPAGNIQNCLAAGADVYKWCSEKGFIDYICPQIYWTFDSPAAPFAERCAEWKSMVKLENIDFYVGLALYKAGSDADGGRWLKSDSIIADQISHSREEGIDADGFMIFSYDYLKAEQSAKEVENIRALLAQD